MKFINGKLYANIYLSSYIARIDPDDGIVEKLNIYIIYDYLGCMI